MSSTAHHIDRRQAMADRRKAEALATAERVDALVEDRRSEGCRRAADAENAYFDSLEGPA